MTMYVTDDMHLLLKNRMKNTEGQEYTGFLTRPLSVCDVKRLLKENAVKCFLTYDVTVDRIKNMFGVESRKTKFTDPIETTDKGIYIVHQDNGRVFFFEVVFRKPR